MTSIQHGFLAGSSCPIVAVVEDVIRSCATNEHAGSRMLGAADHYADRHDPQNWGTCTGIMPACESYARSLMSSTSCGGS